jgi:hypothetical protein
MRAAPSESVPFIDEDYTWGLIILGVEADKTTNNPVWPPRGMPKAQGIEANYSDLIMDAWRGLQQRVPQP